MMLRKSFTVLFVHIFILPAVFSQNRWIRQQVQVCNTPDNGIGACVTLTNCPSLVRLYGSNGGSPQVVQYLKGVQRSCGTRNIGGDPVVCCKEAYRGQQRITTPFPLSTNPTRAVTNPPTRPVTQSPTVSRATTTSFTFPQSTSSPTAQIRTNNNCYGPDAVAGTCKPLTDCAVLLKRLQQNPKNTEYAQFLRQSNEICEQPAPIVCCPSGNSVTPNVDPNENNFSETPATNPDKELFVNRLPTVEDGCGRTNNTFRKIVGGVDAKLGAWPWIALLGYEEPSGIKFKCGGSLITQRHILTAAHCIRNDLRLVRLGEHDLRTDTETKHVDIPIANSEKHSGYTRRDGFADIGLIYLQRSVTFTDLIKPVCLPRSVTLRSKSYVDYTPFVVGWGLTMEAGKSAPVLQELQIPIYQNSECTAAYRKNGKYISDRQFGDTVLCAGVLAGGKDTCQGDSGGPLMIPENVGGTYYFYELGIVSYGIGCARPETPGIYTNVQRYIDWIEQKVANTR